jgi:hypothetical protein
MSIKREKIHRCCRSITEKKEGNVHLDDFALDEDVVGRGGTLRGGTSSSFMSQTWRKHGSGLMSKGASARCCANPQGMLCSFRFVLNDQLKRFLVGVVFADETDDGVGICFFSFPTNID